MSDTGLILESFEEKQVAFEERLESLERNFTSKQRDVDRELVSHDVHSSGLINGLRYTTVSRGQSRKTWKRFSKHLLINTWDVHVKVYPQDFGDLKVYTQDSLIYHHSSRTVRSLWARYEGYQTEVEQYRGCAGRSEESSSEIFAHCRLPQVSNEDAYKKDSLHRNRPS